MANMIRYTWVYGGILTEKLQKYGLIAQRNAGNLIYSNPKTAVTTIGVLY